MKACLRNNGHLPQQLLAFYCIEFFKIGVLHPCRLTWNIIMEVEKMIFLPKWVIYRFHVNLPGCNITQHQPFFVTMDSHRWLDPPGMCWSAQCPWAPLGRGIGQSCCIPPYWGGPHMYEYSTFSRVRGVGMFWLFVFWILSLHSLAFSDESS